MTSILLFVPSVGSRWDLVKFLRPCVRPKQFGGRDTLWKTPFDIDDWRMKMIPSFRI